jgi:hypothetical protein
VATFDQLSAEQRAIVELVLQRGKRYDELSEMLGMPEPRVRELARDALVELAPLTGKRVEEDWRGQLADYVLGQQSGPEATATRGHLRRSEPARAWARSLLDSLEQLFENGSMPAIPEGERGGRTRRPDESGGGGGLAAVDVMRRRRGLAIVAALAVVALVAVLVWPVGVVTGGSDDDKSGSSQQAACVSDGVRRSPQGVAVLVGQGKQRAVTVQATGLQPSTRRCVYQAWLYNGPGRVRSIGAQNTQPNGNFSAAGTLPTDFAKYRFIDISREPLNGAATHSGDSVLRGAIPKKLNQVKDNKLTRLGQMVLQPPAG